MKKRTWEVWTEDEQGNENVLFSGSETKARQYYKKNGGTKAGLHLGYSLGSIEE